MNSFVLASASAVRARLLAAAGIETLRDPAEIDESPIKADHRLRGTAAGDCALALAAAKARSVAARHPAAFVLGADQILCCEDRWFDKPRDLDEARDQLRALRGRRHELVTAAAIVHSGELRWQGLERPQLTMRHFSDAFLERYLGEMATRVTATVGAYELEGWGVQLMEKIEGDYFSILGLPLLPVLAFLRKAGMVPI